MGSRVPSTNGKPERSLFQTDLHAFKWKDGSEIQLEQFKSGSESFSALVTALDGDKNLIAHERMNLIAERTRSSAARSLSKRWPRVTEAEWSDRFLEIAYTSGVKWREGGSQLVRLSEVELNRTLPSLLLPPVVIERGVVIIYGDGSAGKSMVVLALMLSVCTGHPILGLSPTRTGPVIYFDWEDNEQTLRERAEAICAAAGIPFPDNFFYREMDRPIAAGEERIRREVEETGAVCAAFDSMGMMLGGDPSDPVLVIPAVNVMKRTGIACLGIHHLSAAAAGSSDLRDKQKAYGSVYARNGARSQWLVERFQEEEADEGFLYLFQTKVNRGKKSRPLSWRIAYESDGNGYLTNLHYEPRTGDVMAEYLDRKRETQPQADITVPEAVEQFLSKRNLQYLESALMNEVIRIRGRSMTVQTLRNRLNEMRKRGEVFRFENANEPHDPFWGLASGRDDY